MSHQFTPDPASMFERNPATTVGIDHKEPIETWVYAGSYKYGPGRRPCIEVMYRDSSVVVYRHAMSYNRALNKGLKGSYSSYHMVGPKKFKKDVKGFKLTLDVTYKVV